tara:strand:+ start:84 stop:509 length:426 start_codon:yes stop_codon:yes gene_type:complete
MSREKETIHLTATSRGWASKGGKGLGYTKGSKSSFVKKSKTQKDTQPSKGKDENPPKDDKKLTFEAWQDREMKAGTKYESKESAQKAYDIYTGKSKKPAEEKPKTKLTAAYTTWLVQNGVKDSADSQKKYTDKTGKKPLNP